MRFASMVLLGLLAASCATVTPREHAEMVAAMPGTKPLRVGVVVLGSGRALPAAFAEAAAAPGGAAPLPIPGTVYAEQTLLPESLPADEVVTALQQLGAFTDIVQLPFDTRGVASREAMIQRVQDRVWPTAIKQELDAILVIEGVEDRGLHWSSEAEGLFTLDTVLWWLAWPFGLWIPDRDYTADCGLVAAMFWMGDASSNPQPVLMGATAMTQSLAPWDRASAPLLGLLLPPAWLADDPVAVAQAVSVYSREVLPASLVQQIKQTPLASPVDVDVALRVDGGQFVLEVHSGQAVQQASLVSLPRGALADAAQVVAHQIALRTEMEWTAQGPQHISIGQVARGDVEVVAQSLVRVRVVLVSGEQVSRTWTLADFGQ